MEGKVNVADTKIGRRGAGKSKSVMNPPQALEDQKTAPEQAAKVVYRPRTILIASAAGWARQKGAEGK